MSMAGLSKSRLERMHQVLSGYVERQGRSSPTSGPWRMEPCNRQRLENRVKRCIGRTPAQIALLAGNQVAKKG